MHDLSINDVVSARFESPLAISYSGKFFSNNAYVDIRGGRGNYALVFNGDISINDSSEFVCTAYGRKIFFQLGTARLLEVRNPAYSCFLLAEQSKNRIKDYLSRVLSEEDLEKVSNLSKDFRDQIKGVLTTEDVSVCNF